MTLDADILEKPAAEPRGVDPRIVRAEKWLVMVWGLAQMGLWITGVVTREAAANPEDLTWRGLRIKLPFGLDPGLAFERMFRVLRLALLLTKRIEGEIWAYRNGQSLDPAPPRPAQGVARKRPSPKRRDSDGP